MKTRDNLVSILSFNLFLLIISASIILSTLLSCTIYIPSHAKKRWGIKETNQQKQNSNEETISFDNIPYLVSWHRKYTTSPYDSLGGVRGTQATYNRLRYEMARKFAQLEGKNSDASKRFNDLMNADFLIDSIRIEIIYEKTFGSYAPAFNKSNLIDDALFNLAEQIKNNRWIYPNPYLSHLLRENDLLRLTLAHLENPEIKDLGHNIIHVEFPSRHGEYLMIIDSLFRSSSKIYKNPKKSYLSSIKEQNIEFGTQLDIQFGMQLATYDVSVYPEEAFRYFFEWNQTIDIKREDTLQAQILNVMLPGVDTGYSNSINKVDLEVNYFFPLDKIGIKNDSLYGKLESVVTNMETAEEVIYGRNNFTISVYNLPSEGIYNMKLLLPGIHTIDSLKMDGSNSQYKISSRITTPIGQHIRNSFFSLPNDKFSAPVWDMQRVRPKSDINVKQFYLLDKIVKRGDSLLFEIPITDAFPFIESTGDTIYSSAVHLYWQPDIRKDKNKNDSIVISDLRLLDWSPTDYIDSSIINKHTYRSAEGEIVFFDFNESSAHYFKTITLELPIDIELGKGNFQAIVVSYDYYGTKIEQVICEAVWRGIVIK